MCKWSAQKLILTLIFALLLSSCKKFVTIPPSEDLIVSELIFSDNITATGAVSGIYNDMVSANGTQFTASGMTIYAGMCADELTHFSPNSRAEYLKNQLTEASHSTLSAAFWDNAYKYIYTANLCLEGLNKSTGVTDSVKKKLQGECYFVRAFNYFYLINLFGAVPLALVPDFWETAELGRESTDKIYDQIISDLVLAQTLMPETYEYINGVERRIRPNKWAAGALLARVYLYRKNWVNAELQSSAVIGSGLYNLQHDPNDVFLANTPQEVIWQLLPLIPNPPFTVNNTWEGSLILPPVSTSVAPQAYLLTNELLQAFEPNDIRRDRWVGSRTYQGNTYYFPRKYKIKGATVDVTEYYTVLRLAEQYLIRAEARAKQNKLALAAEDINVIRDRAELPPTTAVTEEELLSAVEQERRIELFAEWGHRWLDLKRTNRADIVLGPLKSTTWQSTDVLWPIPIGQIRLNEALTQNPGY